MKDEAAEDEVECMCGKHYRDEHAIMGKFVFERMLYEKTILTERYFIEKVFARLLNLCTHGDVSYL